MMEDAPPEQVGTVAHSEAANTVMHEDDPRHQQKPPTLAKTIKVRTASPRLRVS